MKKPTNTLGDLKAAFYKADDNFMEAIHRDYPRADEFVFYRAVEAVKAGRGDKWDVEMAGNESICAAHTAYVSALHAYYEARDGAGGVLGRVTR